jgi:hypothetical protein
VSSISLTFRYLCVVLWIGASLACGSRPNPVGPTDDHAETVAVPPASTVRRAPDPGHGERLPLPDLFFVVQQVASEHPHALQHSCQPHGGSWEFMDRVVESLREHDARWAYNAKRGNFHDPSHDAIFYHAGAGPSEGSTDGYIVDIIVGHCGDRPGPSWFDVSDDTYWGGTTGGYLYPRP